MKLTKLFSLTIVKMEKAFYANCLLRCSLFNLMSSPPLLSIFVMQNPENFSNFLYDTFEGFFFVLAILCLKKVFEAFIVYFCRQSFVIINSSEKRRFMEILMRNKCFQGKNIINLVLILYPKV
jgi:hypothetical protein